MKEVNELLYKVLEALYNNHISNGGKIDYPEKCYKYIADTLDLIAIKYFNLPPDGDNQQRVFDEGGEQLTDADAYDELIIRFANTIIS